ncbi:hypothetical protein LCGC14_1415090 [marine sediment metagenome]|uniref:Methyltransferase domain-containing protein n=1 Tax=marine sediment metagenome TaxID=412755 RepID=A0A0F9JT28_9ZZZZ
MKYPDYQTYEKLYANYLDEDKMHKLLNYIPLKDYKDKVAIDICAGSGRITLELFKRGVSEIEMVEQERAMIIPEWFNREFRYKEQMSIIYWSIEEYLQTFKDLKDEDSAFLDIAVCQQSINYWLNKKTAKGLAHIMLKDGIFIFNTFNSKPSLCPTPKQYHITGKDGNEEHFTELSWIVDDTIIHHVQTRTGMEPHVTSFKWMSQDYIFSCLGEYFLVSCQNFGKSVYYKCVRK